NGDTTLILAVPASAAGLSATTTFGRFRLSTAGGLATTGAANDGEVEDYAITLAPCPMTVYVDPAYTGTPGTVVSGHTLGYDAFPGPTNVNAGGLAVTGALNNSGTAGGGQVNLNTAGVQLSGTGVVKGQVMVNASTSTNRTGIQGVTVSVLPGGTGITVPAGS